MGGYNLNKDIRTIIIMKIMFVLMLSLLFFGSLIWDLSLFAEEKILKLELESSSANKAEIRTAALIEEGDYYRENYQNIDIVNLRKKLQILNNLDYNQLEFKNDKTIVKMSKVTQESLGKNVKYLRDKGYDIKLKNIQKDETEQLVEMEVKNYE